MKGDAVDITRFPAPKWHAPDGGRYIGTGSFNVTRDPDEGWINCGTYRVMIHDARTAGFYISPGKHGRKCATSTRRAASACRSRWSAAAIRMTFLMACSEVPYGVSEYEIVGGMRGKPVEVINAPVTGLPIPANAEIVHRGLRRARQRARRRAVRRMDRLLRQRPAARAGARHQGDLLPQRSDPARLRAAAPAGRDLPLSRRGALGAAAREHPEGRRAGRRPRPGRTRSATRGCCSRSRSASAIPAMPSRPAISPPCVTSAPIAGAT